MLLPVVWAEPTVLGGASRQRRMWVEVVCCPEGVQRVVRLDVRDGDEDQGMMA